MTEATIQIEEHGCGVKERGTAYRFYVRFLEGQINREEGIEIAVLNQCLQKKKGNRVRVRRDQIGNEEGGV